jgi:hypothetical protein
VLFAVQILDQPLNKRQTTNEKIRGRFGLSTLPTSLVLRVNVHAFLPHQKFGANGHWGQLPSSQELSQ